MRAIRLRAVVMIAGLGTLGAASAVSAQTTSFNALPSLQQFVVPTTGQYDIVAFGAQGGTGAVFASPRAGGLGAQIGGRFTLTQGTTLVVLVGQAGGIAGGFSSQFVSSYLLTGGGGGASAVYIASAAQPLVMAGGGGGGGNNGGGLPGLAGVNGGSGSAGFIVGAAGGVNGGGGAAGFLGGPAQVTAGGGGAGWLADGGVVNGSEVTLIPARTGQSWSGGQVSDTFFSGNGGFGGGGAAGSYGPGGGGGYSGGGGGSFGFGAGGGGSYLNGSTDLALDARSGVRAGEGLVTITFIPAPGAAGLLGLGGLLAARRRRR